MRLRNPAETRSNEPTAVWGGVPSKLPGRLENPREP